MKMIEYIKSIDPDKSILEILKAHPKPFDLIKKINQREELFKNDPETQKKLADLPTFPLNKDEIIRIASAYTTIVASIKNKILAEIPNQEAQTLDFAAIYNIAKVAAQNYLEHYINYNFSAVRTQTHQRNLGFFLRTLLTSYQAVDPNVAFLLACKKHLQNCPDDERQSIVAILGDNEVKKLLGQTEVKASPWSIFKKPDIITNAKDSSPSAAAAATAPHPGSQKTGK